jgi:hypothetical protein
MKNVRCGQIKKEDVPKDYNGRGYKLKLNIPQLIEYLKRKFDKIPRFYLTFT